MSFRSLSDQFDQSVGSVYQKVSGYLSSLPHVADVTRAYSGKYSGILEVDGKFVLVKGYERKIPVLYGLDYTTHDIPNYRLMPSENYQACLQFFNSLKLLDYPLHALICDDNVNIYEAARYIYPKAVIQLCQNHYKENVRRTLDLSLNPHYLPFMESLEDLFSFKRSPDDFNKKAKNILNQCQTDSVRLSIILDIAKRENLLCGWRNGIHIPTTTNLIECFNSHLTGRLKTVKGFESFKHADLWLNGYFLRRRTKKFTGCSGKFRSLNGFTSLEKSKKSDVDLPTFFT